MNSLFLSEPGRCLPQGQTLTLEQRLRAKVADEFAVVSAMERQRAEIVRELFALELSAAMVAVDELEAFLYVPQGGLERAQHENHTLIDAGSTPAPATKFPADGSDKTRETSIGLRQSSCLLTHESAVTHPPVSDLAPFKHYPKGRW